MSALYTRDQLEGNSSQFHWELMVQSADGRFDVTCIIHDCTQNYLLFVLLFIWEQPSETSAGHQLLSTSWWLLCFALSCPSRRIYQVKNAVHIHHVSLFTTRYLLEFRNAPCGTRIWLCFFHWIHGKACLVLVQELELHSRIHLHANILFLFNKMHTV